MTTRVGILLFERVDLLDAGGPYEVFLTAGRLVERGGASSPFDVVTVGVGPGAVIAYGGLGLVPTHTLDNVGPLNVLVIPGAIAIDAVAADPDVRVAVASLMARAELVASVCTGAFLLGDAGLLEGNPFTTHWEDIADLEARLASGRVGQLGGRRPDRHGWRPQLRNRDGASFGGSTCRKGPGSEHRPTTRLPMGSRRWGHAQFLTTTRRHAEIRWDAVASCHQPQKAAVMPHSTESAGIQVAFDVEGDGPDIILVHGITENREAWGAAGKKMARVGRVIAVDLRGHGESGAGGSYALDALAADVKAVADAVGAAQPTLIGHSLGGFVASVYAASFPTRTVVNVDQPLALAGFKDQLGQVEPMLRSDAFPDVMAGMFEGLMGPLPDAEKDRLRSLRRPNAEVVLSIWDPIFSQSVAELDTLTRSLLSDIDCAYLAIHGEEPGEEYRTWLGSVVPQASIEVWEGGGHYPHLVETDRFIARVQELVN